MNKIINTRIFITIMFLCFLIALIFLENQSYQHVIYSLFAGKEIISIFDKMKFILPVILTLTNTTDYVVYALQDAKPYILPRYGSKKKWINHVFSKVYLINLSVFILMGFIILVIGLIYGLKLESILKPEYLIIIFLMYMGYGVLTVLQTWLTIKYNTTISFAVIISFTILSTYENLKNINWILFLPLGMKVYHASSIQTIICIISMIIINIIGYVLIKFEIEKNDL